MKIKAAYFNNGFRGDKNRMIHRSYSQQTQDALVDILDISTEVYTKDDITNPALSQTEIIFTSWYMPVLTEEEISIYLPNLKIIFYGAGSVQGFARPFLSKGIRVVSAWAANAVSVAEFTAAQIILANKGYFLATVLHKQGVDKARDNSKWEFPGSFDTTVGIIGAGMIGRKVIEILKACNVRINFLVYDPFFPEEKAESLGVRKCSLEELFSQSQTISNHVANNDKTKGMLNYDLFKLMKENAVFINTGRGAQVIEDDLARALTEFPERTALLDVTDPEPPKDGHVFYKMPNVFLTGHIAGVIGRESHRMGEYMLEELKRYLSGEALVYEVTMDMLETMA